MKPLIHYTALLHICIIFLFCKQSYSQTKIESSKKTIDKSFLVNKHFIFHAQTAVPERMTLRQLTTEYNVTIKGDTLTSYLPYFGRAYVAPIGQTDSPLGFSTTNFQYFVSVNKKNNWNVIAKIKDKDGFQYIFNIFNNGNATLTVTSTSRDPISFHGYVSRNE